MDIVTYALCKKMVDPSEDGKVFSIKGEVPSVADLPASGNTNGDVYLVGPNSSGSYDEYYWLSSAEKWEFLGSTETDLSDYLEKEDADNLYGAKDDVEELQEDNELIYIFDE